jgi:hypothetical protein
MLKKTKKKDFKMKLRNVYKNSLENFVANTYGNVVTGAELVALYKDVARKNMQNINMSFVPINVHRWAKKNGKLVGQVKNSNNRFTNLYVFEKNIFAK